ncbi:MAG: hypothetical protein ACRDFX_12135, partial [Chloroflexota bacterium]
MIAKTAERTVLDSYAVLAMLDGAAGAGRVADVLASGEPWMTLINLGEVAYIVERERGKVAADDIFANLQATKRPDGSAPIQWLAIDEVLVRRAAS